MYKSESKNTDIQFTGNTQDEVIKSILFFIMENPNSFYGWKILKNNKVVMFLDNNGNRKKQ